mgnify:CR=1 FL=1
MSIAVKHRSCIRGKEKQKKKGISPHTLPYPTLSDQERKTVPLTSVVQMKKSMGSGDLRFLEGVAVGGGGTIAELRNRRRRSSILCHSSFAFVVSGVYFLPCYLRSCQIKGHHRRHDHDHHHHHHHHKSNKAERKKERWICSCRSLSSLSPFKQKQTKEKAPTKCPQQNPIVRPSKCPPDRPKIRKGLWNPKP